MIYAVGDIHGQLAQLERALALIEADGGGPVVFLGDYVDRGPDSRGVIERLMQVPEAVHLMGNHDRMFLRFLQDGTLTDPQVKSGLAWPHTRMGGAETLRSYGVELPDDLLDMTAEDVVDAEPWRAALEQAMPEAHVAFLRGLKLMHQTDHHVFVHAGIRPGLPLGFQEEDDLLWIRDPFLNDRRDHGPLIVHGHTALEHPEHCGNRVNLDGGAGFGRPLHPAVFEGRRCWLLTEDGRVPLGAAQ